MAVIRTNRCQRLSLPAPAARQKVTRAAIRAGKYRNTLKESTGVLPAPCSAVLHLRTVRLIRALRLSRSRTVQADAARAPTRF